jgi:hypothetical protein
MEHPQYSRGLASADFYLFSRLKSTVKGQRYCDITDVIKNAVEELKRAFTNRIPVMFLTPLQSLPKCVWLLKTTILKEL